MFHHSWQYLINTYNSFACGRNVHSTSHTLHCDTKIIYWSEFIFSHFESFTTKPFVIKLYMTSVYWIHTWAYKSQSRNHRFISLYIRFPTGTTASGLNLVKRQGKTFSWTSIDCHLGFVYLISINWFAFCGFIGSRPFAVHASNTHTHTRFCPQKPTQTPIYKFGQALKNISYDCTDNQTNLMHFRA